MAISNTSKPDLIRLHPCHLGQLARLPQAGPFLGENSGAALYRSRALAVREGGETQTEKRCAEPVTKADIRLLPGERT